MILATAERNLWDVFRTVPSDVLEAVFAEIRGVRD
jgi:hypothetical protein